MQIDSYRMHGHRARLATLRAGLNHPAEGGEFTIADNARAVGELRGPNAPWRIPREGGSLRAPLSSYLFGSYASWRTARTP